MVASSRIREWFQFVGASLRNECDWKVAAERREHSLSYCACPWGGRVVKFDFKDLLVPGAEHPVDLMPRPEVRTQSHDRFNHQAKLIWRETVAPGDVYLEQTNRFWILLIGLILFGSSGHALTDSDTFFCNMKPTLARHQRRRDWPEHGDCAYANFQNHSSGLGQEFLFVVRPTSRPNYFRLIVHFRIPEAEKLMNWASNSLLLMADLSRQAVSSFFRRPGMSDMRKLDAEMYVVLGMRNFHKGWPLLPAVDGSVCISCRNGRQDLQRWSYFVAHGATGFNLSEYLSCFMEQLGYKITTYESLDGRVLVPYQCVVLRSEWVVLRSVFSEAFGIQKGAYRRAHGGKTAPSLQEDITPHYCGIRDGVSADGGSDGGSDVAQADHARELHRCLVVRKTFLEVLEEPEGTQPPLHRSKTEPSLLELAKL